MKLATSLALTAGITALAASLALSPVRADDCDDIVDAIKKHGERVMMSQGDPKGAALCAAMGHLRGLMEATRIVADECYDEGKKRDDIMKDMAEGAKTMADEIEKTCK